jgi:wyosine [tRNA(Phe)-imidazoG37] synthetase (radical SAM superfamily)
MFKAAPCRNFFWTKFRLGLIIECKKVPLRWIVKIIIRSLIYYRSKEPCHSYGCFYFNDVMKLHRKYTFGPVPSRRLGLSLGVDIIPKKLCTLDCIYCEVGVTDKRGLARKEYIPAGEILQEVKEVLQEYPHLDHITISGSGEPTLNAKLGEIIRGIKMMTRIPVAVLTNGTLFSDPRVRQDLMDADIVSPSLDAVTPEVFEKVDRPNPKLKIDKIIEGIKSFKREYRGRLWMEILFVEGINDTDDEVNKMKKVIGEISPEKVHLNTVIRPPAYSSAKPVGKERLEEIQQILGNKSEIIGFYSKDPLTAEHETDGEAILGILSRRPMTVEQMAVSMSMKREEISSCLELLLKDGSVRAYIFNGEEFYQAL